MAARTGARSFSDAKIIRNLEEISIFTRKPAPMIIRGITVTAIQDESIFANKSHGAGRKP